MKAKKQKLESSLFLEYTAELYKKLDEAILLDYPVIIYGGTGKASFVSPYIDIFIDSREISDIKSLAGFYAVADGEIKYVEGELIKSLKEGLSVCFKRIDENSELLQFLYPTFKNKTFVCNNGEIITAHANFRIFFTSKVELDIKGLFVGPIRFAFDDVISNFKLKSFLINLFANIQDLCPSGVRAKENVSCNNLCSKVRCINSCLKIGKILCDQHFRILMKLHNRIKGYTTLSHEARLEIFDSITSLFLEHPSKELFNILALGALPLLSLPFNLAKTQAVDWALRCLLSNIKNGEHTLLIGETGTGKTALVGHLAKHSNYYLGYDVVHKTLNMSSDFDGSDLIGGYRSINFQQKVQVLFKKACLEIPVQLSVRGQLEHLLHKLENGSVKKEAVFLQKQLEKRAHFEYKEGILTKAMKEGHWLLLDEINLCTEETLRIIEALISKKYVILYDTDNHSPMPVHPNFRLFACMNPHGDHGKKKFDSDTFTSLYFPDFSENLEDIKLVADCIARNSIPEKVLSDLCNFFYDFKFLILKKDISNVFEPLVTGRTFVRLLNYVLCQSRNDHCSVNIEDVFTNKRICDLSSISELPINRSTGVHEHSSLPYIFKGVSLLFFTQLNPYSQSIAFNLYKKYFNFSSTEVYSTSYVNGFVLTPTVKQHLRLLVSCVEANLPVLLQGDTSTGKTSLVVFLAKLLDKKVIRINNHEHTEASDYTGSYCSTKNGIQFKPGVLITALEEGHWVILDELNLAPTDVLEILNRLLDDNRELFVAELDRVIKPHVNFRIFATQNINYGGRKGLSKAFRNRFIELFFHEKPESEILEIIKATGAPKSFCTKMIKVYGVLRSIKNSNSLITLRDLFKWLKRSPGTLEELINTGLDIIYERQRCYRDRRKVLDGFNEAFCNHERIGTAIKCLEEQRNHFSGSTPSKAAENHPAPFFATEVLNTDLQNYLENISSNIILTNSFTKLIRLVYFAWKHKEPILIVGETGTGKTKVCDIVSNYFSTSLRTLNMHNGIDVSDFIGNFVFEGEKIVWKDGPLVSAMKRGESFLIDEINLAEDSVLERLNSLLEDERTIYITEIGEEVKAKESFRILATMNPGTDFGKRELSPALRNRFTEIYYQVDSSDYPLIFTNLLSSKLKYNSKHTSELGITAGYIHYYTKKFSSLPYSLSVRKLELMVEFIAKLHNSEFNGVVCHLPMDPKYVWHEAVSLISTENAAVQCSKEIHDLEVRYSDSNSMYLHPHAINLFGAFPYYITAYHNINYSFTSPTSKTNLQRILRAFILNKGIMLEGDPGIGKTSIIQNIAKLCNKSFVRINLSEQTELSDLVGTYLPAQNGIRFVESELLSVLSSGGWVILDEINLCTQSVIEGLNSVLDYRRTLFIPERVVRVHENTRIFATMNPSTTYNGRKPLPKSFLDRFIRIYMNNYLPEDVQHILSTLFANPTYVPGKSLRDCIKINMIGEYEKNRPIDYKFAKNVNGEYTFNVGTASICIDSCRVPNLHKSYGGSQKNGSHVNGNEINPTSKISSYVLIHSQLQNIETVINCFNNRLSIIISKGVGKYALMEFLSKMYGLSLMLFNCHKDTDVCDMLGQYQKTENGFEWIDSPVVQALISGSLLVFINPHLVEKSVFDRLNSLFESERTLSIYERVLDTKVEVHSSTKMVLLTDSVQLLSPAIIDRCVHIELSNQLDYVDLYKLCNVLKNDIADYNSKQIMNDKRCHWQNENDTLDDIVKREQYHVCMLANDVNNAICTEFKDDVGTRYIPDCEIRHECSSVSYKSFCIDMTASYGDLRLDLRKLEKLGVVPDFLTKHLGIYNTIDELEIDRMFKYKQVQCIPINTTLIMFYKSIIYNISAPKNVSEKIEYLKMINNTPNSIEQILYFIYGCSNQLLAGTKRMKSSSCKLYFPSSINDYKVKLIETYKSLKIKDYKLFESIANIILHTKELTFPDLDLSLFNELMHFDPLILYKQYLTNSFIVKHNEYMTKIYDTMKDIYKYGRGSITQLVDEYTVELNRHMTEISIINRKLGRDFDKFKKQLSNLGFCSFMHMELDIDEFNDLANYYLVIMFYEWLNKNCCERMCCIVDNAELSNTQLGINGGDKSSPNKLEASTPISASIDYGVLCLNMLYNPKPFVLLLQHLSYSAFGPRLSKFIYFFMSKKSFDVSELIYEALWDNRSIQIDQTALMSVNISLEMQILPVDIDRALSGLISGTSQAQLIETRDNTALLYSDILRTICDVDDLKELSVLTSPSIVLNRINELQEDKENNTNSLDTVNVDNKSIYFLTEAFKALVACFKKSSIFDLERNYKFFLYLAFADITPEVAQRYFLDCSLVEFKDRYFFAEELSFMRQEFMLRDSELRMERHCTCGNDTTCLYCKKYLVDECSVKEDLAIQDMRKELNKDGNMDLEYVGKEGMLHRYLPSFTEEQHTLLINLMLQYKAFELDKLYNEKIREGRTKLRKEPKFYREILEDVRVYIMLPVTNLMELKFPAPKIACLYKNTNIGNKSIGKIHDGIQNGSYNNDDIQRTSKIALSHPDRYTYLLKNRQDCECIDWLQLARKYNRYEIQRHIKHLKSKEEVIDRFYSRKTQLPFSEEEIALSKVINQLSENMAYSSLSYMALDNLFVPFLYFVFTYAHESIEEEGEGLGKGTGDRNVSDKIEDENEINDEMGDDQDVLEDDGIDFDNAGSISTVSDVITEAESDVDANEVNDETKESGNVETSSENGDIDEKIAEDQFSDDTCHLSNQELTVEEDSEDSSINKLSDDELASDDESMLSTELNEEEQKASRNNYKYKDMELNNSQTCDVADNFNHRTQGTNNEPVLVPGMGEEEVAGKNNEGTGKAIVLLAPHFRIFPTDCTKLTALLKIALESNKSNKYKGDYKNGKKLNMKRLVPYIASDYRRDKIWMKRRQGDKRDYKLRIFIDNSKSMFSQEMVETLIGVYMKISQSFGMLGIPLELYKFGSTLVRGDVGSYDKQSDENYISGSKNDFHIIDNLYNSSTVKHCMNSASELLQKFLDFTDDESNISWIDNFQDGINVILTDGVFQKYVEYNPNAVVVLIDKCSIRKMNKVSVGEQGIMMQRYLDDFSLNYCVVENIDEIEEVFVNAISEAINRID